MKTKSDIVYSRAQAAILQSSGHSVREIAKLNGEYCVNKCLKRECFEKNRFAMRTCAAYELSYFLVSGVSLGFYWKS